MEQLSINMCTWGQGKGEKCYLGSKIKGDGGGYWQGMRKSRRNDQIRSNKVGGNYGGGGTLEKNASLFSKVVKWFWRCF